MGWKWWNKGTDQHNSYQGDPQQHNGEVQPAYETKTYFKSYSSSRSCRPDPEDSNYLLCTEKVQDGNDTYENQERVPVNQNNTFSRGLFDFSSPFSKHESEPFGKEQGFGRNQFDDFDKAMQDFMTPFFHFPSFFGPSPFEGFNGNNNFFQQSHGQGDRRGYEPRGHNDYEPRARSYDNHGQRQNNYEEGRRKDQRFYFSRNERDYDIKDI